MPVLTFASAKGGAGKTTSAAAIGAELARYSKVAMIDADPSGHHLFEWSRAGELPAGLSVSRSAGEARIQDEIDEATKIAPWVIVDLEGGKSQLNAFAMGAADLVLICTQAEVPDVRSALETIEQIKLQERYLRRPIPFALLFNRTQQTATPRLMRSILDNLGSDAHALRAHLRRRTAFSNLHEYGGGLRDLPKTVSGRDQAIADVEAVAREIIEHLEEANATIR